MPRWKLSSRERATVDRATCGFKISDKRKGKIHTHGGTRTSGKYHVDVKDRVERDPRGRKGEYKSNPDRQRAYRIRKTLRACGLEGDALAWAVKLELRRHKRHLKFRLALEEYEEMKRLDESLHFYDGLGDGPEFGTGFDGDDLRFMREG